MKVKELMRILSKTNQESPIFFCPGGNFIGPVAYYSVDGVVRYLDLSLAVDARGRKGKEGGSDQAVVLYFKGGVV